MIIAGINVNQIVLAVLILLNIYGFSMAGLDSIIKYGYGYMGYLGIAIIIIPFLTVGVYKNRKYLREQTNKQESAENEQEYNEKVS